jgi:hypothetical protein
VNFKADWWSVPLEIKGMKGTLYQTLISSLAYMGCENVPKQEKPTSSAKAIYKRIFLYFSLTLFFLL